MIDVDRVGRKSAHPTRLYVTPDHYQSVFPVGASSAAVVDGAASVSAIRVPVASEADFVGPLPQSPSQVAASWQGSGAYTGVDSYVNTTLPKGNLVVGSVPGQSPYYTTLGGFESTGGTAEGFYEGLQIQPNLTNPAYPPYRSGVTIYQVGGDTNAAAGTALANPQFGPGGVGQIFIPNYQNSLTPLYSIPFKKP